MKRLLIVLALLCCPSFAAVAHVAQGQGTCTNTTSTGAIAGGACNSTSSRAFSYTPTGTGNVVLIGIGTNAASSVTTGSLSLAGWSFTSCSTGAGASGARMAYYWAFAPSTSAASITMTWTVATTVSGFMNVLIDEFSGMDTTTAVSACTAASGSGSPTASVTPASNDNMIEVMCNDSITSTTTGTIDGVVGTTGANDGSQDIAQYRLLTGGSGVSKTGTFPSGSGVYTCGIFAVQPPQGAVTSTGVSKWDKLIKYGYDE